MDASYDSSDDNGLFTPSRGRRKSLLNGFTPTTPSPSHPVLNEKSTTIKKTGANNDVDIATAIAPNTLPRLHDISFLGARLSPIRKKNNEIEDLDDDYDDDDDDAAIVAPYRLGLAETSGSSAATASFFLPINDNYDDDDDGYDDDRYNHIEQAKNAINRNMIDMSNPTGYTRPRPPLLLHPHTSVGKNGLSETNNNVIPSRNRDNNDTSRYNVGSGGSGSGTRNRRRRRRFAPFERKFWNFLSSSSSSSSSSSPEMKRNQRSDDVPHNSNNEGIYSSYVMVDHPRTTNSSGIITNNNIVVIGATALVLFCIGLHDAFIAYLAFRRGITMSERSYTLTWNFPWIGPTYRSLLRFGAFCPERLLSSSFSSSSEYWRCLTSIFVTTSVIEWLLLAWVWTKYIPSVSSRSSLLSPSWHLSWPVVYLLSAFTGQLWMVAFEYNNMGSSSSSSSSNVNNYDYNSNYDTAATTTTTVSTIPTLSGCAGWATAGVLCSVGIQRPNRRFPCFISAIVLVILQTCQTTGNTIGCSTGSFFGWAFSGIWGITLLPIVSRRRLQQREILNYDYNYDTLNDTEDKTNSNINGWNFWNGLAAGIAVLLWLLPISYLFSR